jgi:hypothetical protein
LWIHDNTYLTNIGIDVDRIYISFPYSDNAQYYSLDATVFHTYTIVGEGQHRRLSVDGVLVLDYEQPLGVGEGTKGLPSVIWGPTATPV